MIKKSEIEKISRKLDKLNQLIEFTSIETILVTIWIAMLIFSITLFATVEDIWWLVTAWFLFPITFIPLVLYLSQFLSSAENRYFHIKYIITIECIYIIMLMLTIISLQIVTFFHINIGIVDIRPIYIFSIFEIMGFFFYFWDNVIEANIDRKFPDLKMTKKPTIPQVLKKFLTKLFSKNGLIALITLFVSSMVLFSIIVESYIQGIIISVIGFIDVLFILFNSKKKKDRKNKNSKNRKENHEILKTDKNKKNTRKDNEFKEILSKKHQNIQTLLTIITAFLMLISIFYAYQTVEYSKSVVDWYEHPKPLLIHWSNPIVSQKHDISWEMSILDTYDPSKGIEIFPHIQHHLNITIRNVGRAPLTNGFVVLDFQVDNLTEERFPTFPFKIINYKNPLNALMFIDNPSNRSKQKMVWHSEMYYRNSYDVLDFPPTINYTKGDPEYTYPLPKFNIGHLNPDEETWISLDMFAAYENATGSVLFSILSSNSNPYKITIPIRSK